MPTRLEPGLLSRLVPRQLERARASGDLEPTATREHRIDDGGIAFTARVIVGADAKRRWGRVQRRTGTDPFEPPYRDELFVTDVSDTHAVLLNKFPVLADHLLVVTRAFEPQERALGGADLEALWACIAEQGGLGFYNAGPAAGASQPHKHLQWIPLPGELPTLPLFEAADRGFACAHARVAGGDLVEHYRALCDDLRLGAAEPAPYNLLLTRDWMVVVPRTRHAWQGVAVNAMGFAGSFLVRDEAGLHRLRELGPRRVLAAVARGS